MNYNNKTNLSPLSPPPSHEGMVVKLLALFSVLLFVLCFLLSCSREEVAGPSAEGVPVSFQLSAIEGSVTEDGGPATRVTLEEGTTVRMVIRNWAANSEPGALASECIEKDYTTQADGTLVPTDGEEVRLIEYGKYSFFVVTPALTIETLESGILKVDVPQLVDFGFLRNTQVEINKWTTAEGGAVKRIVKLTGLKHECAKLTFAVDLAKDVAPTITDTKIVGVKLTDMPETTTIYEYRSELEMNGGRSDLVIPGSAFKIDPTDRRKASGGAPVLPKVSGTFNLSMNVQFNGVTSVTTPFPAVSLPAMSFDRGKEYAFTIRLTKDRLGNPTVGLWLAISKWNASDQDIVVGGPPDKGPIDAQLLGTWSNITWEAGMGGVPNGETIITGVSGWWTNIYYNPHLGSSDGKSND